MKCGVLVMAAFVFVLRDAMADEAPRIEIAPHDQRVLSGGVVSFVCTASGDPKPQIEWRKNGKRVTTQRYTVQEMTKGSVLRIEPVRQARDDATYECVAENGIGEPVRAIASLTVLQEGSVAMGFPRFSLQPSIQGVERGRSALLPCRAEGDPEPNISWLKDMVPVDMTNHRYSIVQGASLQIVDAEEEDQGTYECVAENSFGTAVSSMATLYVRVRRVPPYFSIPPEPVYEVTPGGHLNVTCVAVGSPMPYVKWKRGSFELNPDETPPIGKNILRLENVRDSSNYTCVASSKLGTIDAPTQVLVQAFPRAPASVQASDVTATSVRLSWSYEVGVENIIYYVIQYKPKHANQDYSEISGITTNFYTIRDLSPYTEYEFFVIAVNAIGRGSPSVPAIVSTGETVEVPGNTKPGSSPRNVQARPLSSSTVLIQWDPPKEPNGQVTGYKVFYTTRPNTPTHSWQSQTVDNGKLTTINDLAHQTIYTIRVQAFTSRGPGPLSAPVQVKTQQGVPSQPTNLRAFATSSTMIQVSWSRPSHVGETLLEYELYWNDTFTQQEYKRSLPDVETYTLGELYPDTLYFVWVSAKSRLGEGAATPPFPVRTEQYVPGEPSQVTVTVLNSTSVRVVWKAPANRDRNGLIRGYQIYVQETNKEGDLVSDPLKYDVADEDAEEYNVTNLQPDTDYLVQVAAVTRKGDGTRSWAKPAHTLGGVPTRPEVSTQISGDDVELVVHVRWTRPTHTYGQLLGYRLRYGRLDSQHMEELELEPQVDHTAIKQLDRGARFEFRLSGQNGIGWGQEAITLLDTPEGVPSAPPMNVSHRRQSPTTVVVTWDPPLAQYRNGHILLFGYQFFKISDQYPVEKNATQSRIVFSSLDENTEYLFRVRAFTFKGPSPWSAKVTVRTPGDVPPAPTNVQAMATSEVSVEVWWDPVPYFKDILGYQVLYTQTAVEDLDLWSSKRVPLTWSAEISGLDTHTMYAVRVAAYTDDNLGRLSELITVRVTPTDVPVQVRAHGVTTHTMTLSWRPPTKLDPVKYQISYGAHKEFYDNQGDLQVLSIRPQTVLVDSNRSEYTIDQLLPFTSYQVNITAVPPDGLPRPPAKITVTTDMAAPKPMVKPDSVGVEKGQIKVILPQASEEYGPIKYYFLVVVPESMAVKVPDSYTIEDLTKTAEDQQGPYIAGKFLRRSMPKEFLLGDQKKYHQFLNRRLSRSMRYKVFVRAVVDTPQQSLFTNSPFSESLTLDQPNGIVGYRGNRTDMPSVDRMDGSPDVLWIVVSAIVIALVTMCVVTIIIVKRRRQIVKTVAGGETTLKLLVGGGGGPGGQDPPSGIPPSTADPVELRRLKYQTPAMMSHPPIPVNELAAHIETLKANENLQFSQEYESIEPGQQFTWENSNLELNKPKNRYANVIAYDHSRVVLQPIDNVPGSDYINANYCDGYRKQNAYIATQGPLGETIGDFWRMVWEQRSSTIVMMTKLEERTRIKCDQYWPSRGSEVYGGMVEVTLADVQELATYCIRTFHLQKCGGNERREVRQFQFTAWPDHGVPDHPTPFLIFLRRVRAMNPPEAGPMIVHCSAGVGRTGCFIVIDSMLERLKHENTVDIYGHVTCLRAQRNYMCQTEDQYVFIHDAVLEAVLAGNTEVAARHLYAHIQAITQVLPVEGCTALQLEFRKLSAMKMQTSKFVSANLPVNKFKNRLMNILPYEAMRVCLQPIRGVDGSDYINASFIDGYRYRNAYIATQGPLQETTEDFWRMLWEHNSNIIVILTQLKEMGREKCHQYWPNERSQRYLYYVVDPITEYNMPQYVLREFKVTDARDGQSRTVRQFHFVDWPEQGVPKLGEGFIEFIGQVHKTKEQFGQEGPITVHCSGGVGRTGVFITLSIVLERMQYEGVVDMYQTVRTLRTQRPGMVQTEEQYQFCYKAALEYLGSFDHYAN